MKLSYVLFASLATTATAGPQRLRHLDGHESMSMPSAHAKASKEEVEDMPEEVMSVDSKATKLFKEPYAPKTGKVSMPEVEAASKAAKVQSME